MGRTAAAMLAWRNSRRLAIGVILLRIRDTGGLKSGKLWVVGAGLQ
jgi:hypothetical protein